LELQKRLFSPRNPLKFPKTAKAILGKTCRLQAENLEKLDKKLGKVWRVAREVNAAS
jgi:hypothetical protein